MSKISMIVSVWNDSLWKQYTNRGVRFINLTGSPRVYKSDINLLLRGLYILHKVENRTFMSEKNFTELNLK